MWTSDHVGLKRSHWRLPMKPPLFRSISERDTVLGAFEPLWNVLSVKTIFTKKMAYPVLVVRGNQVNSCKGQGKCASSQNGPSPALLAGKEHIIWRMGEISQLQASSRGARPERQAGSFASHGSTLNHPPALQTCRKRSVHFQVQASGGDRAGFNTQVLNDLLRCSYKLELTNDLNLCPVTGWEVLVNRTNLSKHQLTRRVQDDILRFVV